MKKLKIALAVAALALLSFELVTIFRPCANEVGLFQPPLRGDPMFYQADGSPTSNYHTFFVALTNRLHRAGRTH